MACFWKNERNAVEVCLREVGNYVYIGYEAPDPEYSLVEVARDLSGYVKTDFFGPTTFGNSLYSKRRQIYQLRYNTTPNPDTVTLWRDDGEPTFTEVPGVPTGLSAVSKQVIYTNSKLRGVNEVTGSVVSFYESDDGEVWSLLPGSASVAASVAGFPGSCTVTGSRIVTNRTSGTGVPQFYYSDDGGTTWSAGSGATGNSSTPGHPFLHSGSNIISIANTEIYVSADGSAWTKYTGLFAYTGGYMQFSTVAPQMAANGTGRVVIIGQLASGGAYGFAYSTNHGASWTLRTQVAGGLPDTSDVWSIHWDDIGEQFVIFAVRGDTGTSQIYTSPTGQTWTAGIVIPDLVRSPTQVID